MMDDDHAGGAVPPEIDDVMSHEVLPDLCDICVHNLDEGMDVDAVISHLRHWVREARKNFATYC